MSDEEEVDLGELHKELCFAFKEVQGASAFSLERDRPYDGQPHTDCGVRGKTLVAGLTMRDVSDCMVKGFLASAGIPERGNPCHDDIYQIDLAKIDPGAVITCSMCEMEKMMGIFPNVPKAEHIREPSAPLSRPPAEAAGSEHRWRFSCGRVHEECVGCALRSVEPPECEGHTEGAIACERFKPLRPPAEDQGGAE